MSKMSGRPGRIKNKGSEASTSQDGDTPKTTRLGKRGGGRPRKSAGADDSLLDSEFGSRESSPFSPANPPCLKRRTPRGEAQLINLASEFDNEEDFRSHRLARFIAENPDCREDLARLQEDRPSFPPWIEEKDLIEHDGMVYRTGDIVCLFDNGEDSEEDDDNDEKEEGDEDLPYYAQIRSLIHDQFMRPFAWITWLVPTGSARDRHEFDPEHFVHSLIDHKLYELESLRWECDRPDLPAYQVYDDHRAVLDKHRLSRLRKRRLELYRAANFEFTRGVDVVRAGDVKTIHEKEHADELKEVLERAQERGIERRKEMERRAEEGEGEETEDKEKTKEKDFKSDDEEEEVKEEEAAGEEMEGEGEGEEPKKMPEGSRKRARTTSQTSDASKGTCESAESSAKPMEED